MSNKNSQDSNEKNTYEDFFSSSEPQDFEDISSGREDSADTPKADSYEDFFTGREEEEEDSPFDSSFFTEMNENEKEEFKEATELPKDIADVGSVPQNMPYHYHYSHDEGTAQHAQNGDEILSMDSRKPHKKSKKHLGRNITLSVIAVVLALILAFLGIGYGTLKKTLALVDTVPLKENAYIENSALLHAPDVKNILLVGSDAREGQDAEKTRSDTMLLISIDKKNKQIKLTSFLRDLYVDIPGYRKDKINAAHSHGGTQLLVDTIETNFKVPIDGYVLVTFDIFRALIDSFGGVDVEVTEKEANYINSKDHMAPEDVEAFSEPIQEGKQHFNGAQALWYSRIRYLDSDFMRTARQRKVLSALLSKITKKSPTALLDAAKSVLPLLRTSYSGDEILALGKELLGCINYPSAEQQIPAVGAYKSQRKRGQSCLVPNMKKNIEILHNFILEKAELPKEEEKQENK